MLVSEDQYTDRERAFSNEVRRLRESRQWTLAEMAAALRSEGVDYASSMTVSRTEKLQRPVRMSESMAYGRVFGRTVYELTEPDSHADFLNWGLRAVENFRSHQAQRETLTAQLRTDVDEMRHWATMIRSTYTPEYLDKLSPFAQGRWDHSLTQIEVAIADAEGDATLSQEAR